MSDGTSELTAPSTADIATEVYDSFETAEPSTETPATTETAAPVVMGTGETVEPSAPAIVQPAPTEAEKLLAADGYKTAKKPDGRENYIPYSKVVKIIENGLNQGKGQFGAQHQALQQEHTTLKSTYAQVRPVLEALDQGPEAFLAEAAKHDPRYKAFLETRSQPAAAPVPLDLPAPDYVLPDGSKTYSLKGISENLIPFIVTQATKQAEAAADARLKPITEREKKAAEDAKVAEWETQKRERTQSTLKEAQGWAYFGKLAEDGSLTEFQTSVLEELRKDSAEAEAAGRRPSLSLEGAYLRVATPRIAEDDAKKRARWAEEHNRAAKASPTVGRTGGETPRVGPSDTHSIASRVYDRLSAS